VCAGKSHYWKDDGSTVGAGLAGDAEMYPYVSLTLNIEYAA
jgi:V-type H+-transporting ATPase subunit C